MIKITYIISELKIGGAEKLLENIISKLSEKNFIINLIVLGRKEENALYEKIKSNNVNIFYCNKKGKEIIKCSIKIKKILAQIKPDIVHVHTSILYLAMYGIIANNIKGRLYTIHSMPQFDSPGVKKYIYSLFFNIMKVKGIAISKKIEIESRKYFKTSNIIRIENGININHFKSNISIADRNITKILHVGRFIKVKNQKKLIEAIESLGNLDLEVTFVGDGETLFENIELVKKYKLERQIKFLGYRNDIKDIMDENAIFILCSKVEGAPISIIEAMANGMAIISTDVGGITDFIDDNENGVILKNDSKEELVEAIKELLENKDKIIELGNNAIEKSKVYDMKTCFTKHMNLYEEILKL